MELLAGNAPPASPQTQSLIETLFAQNDAKGRQSIQSLIDDIGQTSLSAIIAPETSSSQDLYLRTLILSAALPVQKSSDYDSTKSLHLPQQSITQRVFLKYRHTVLPDLPFMSEDSVLQHLGVAYFANIQHYSIFITALMLATTAVHISPGSVARASGLHRTAVFHLEAAFSSEPQSEPLRDLEAVMGLAFFAALAADDYSDAWALSGIAMRICVDLGLHKFADSEQKRRLFWSAFTLDRKIAASRNLPVGLSDKSISAEFPSSTIHPFKLYSILSELYYTKSKADVGQHRRLSLQLEEWLQTCSLQRPLSHNVEQDVATAKRILSESNPA